VYLQYEDVIFLSMDEILFHCSKLERVVGMMLCLSANCISDIVLERNLIAF